MWVILISSDMIQKYLYVTETGKTGKGLFTNKAIKKGNIALIMRGETKKRFYKNRHEASAEPNMMGIGKNLNHSCDPNTGIKGRVTFIALRDIKPGEELTFDYSISEDSEWEMRCKCGAKNCRGIIKGVRLLPEKNFKRLLPYIPKYFQKIWEKYNGPKKKIVYG